MDGHVSIPANSPSNPQVRARFFSSPSTKVWLHKHKWLAADPKAVVFLLHGWGDHAARYTFLAEEFRARGISVVSFDQQGHGLSGGDRSWFSRFDHLVVDAEFAFQELLRDDPKLKNIPRFLLGHSLGSAVAVSVAQRAQSKWDGIVLSGLLVGGGENLENTWLKLSAQLLSPFVPRLAVCPTDVSAISSDPENRIAFTNDPAVFRGFGTARAGAEALVAVENIQKYGHLLNNTSILAVHGSDDRTSCPKSAAKFLNQTGSKDTTFQLEEGLGHEVLFEGTRGVSLSHEILQWVEQRA